MPPSTRLGLIMSLIIVALWVGWMIAKPEPMQATKPLPSSDAIQKTKASTTGAGQLTSGDPVDKLRAARSSAEREEVMAAFMALGHDRNAAMLIDALRDESAKLRLQAVEHAASLSTEFFAQVLEEAVVNDNADVREMGWSLLAPHPMESKVPVVLTTIARGSEASLEEMFSEMGRTPERSLFEAMILAAERAQGTRQTRVLKELQEWLVPGGGEVPRFENVSQISAWWKTNQQHYDEFLLRVDL